MADLDIGTATKSTMDTRVPDYSVPTAKIDSATGQEETTYVNTEWSKQLGYYKNILFSPVRRDIFFFPK